MANDMELKRRNTCLGKPQWVGYVEIFICCHTRWKENVFLIRSDHGAECKERWEDQNTWRWTSKMYFIFLKSVFFASLLFIVFRTLHKMTWRYSHNDIVHRIKDQNQSSPWKERLMSLRSEWRNSQLSFRRKLKKSSY